MVITLLNKSERKLQEHNEDGLQQRENRRNNQSKLQNMVTKMKIHNGEATKG